MAKKKKFGPYSQRPADQGMPDAVARDLNAINRSYGYRGSKKY